MGYGPIRLQKSGALGFATHSSFLSKQCKLMIINRVVGDALCWMVCILGDINIIQVHLLYIDHILGDIDITHARHVFTTVVQSFDVWTQCLTTTNNYFIHFSDHIS